MRRADGFTLIELITIISLLGILAAVALPRMDTNAYHEAVFHDQALAALRYAQKTAVSHRRPVCVSFANDQRSLALSIDTNLAGGCDTALPIPGTSNNRIVSSHPLALFSPVPSNFTFAASGTTTNQNIDFLNGSRITVVGATGNVF